MSDKLPYPEWVARSGLRGDILSKRKIIRCSKPGAWYEGEVGKIIMVHYFSTFGAWDEQGRNICYYDLSAPVLY